MTLICTSQYQVDSQLAFELPGGEQLVLSRDFVEWFRGFTDAEGCFNVLGIKGSNYYSFRFILRLHYDDRDVLIYIKNTLGIGKVYFSADQETTTFKVTSRRELAIIIAIFDKFHLNTTKHLYFLAFALAFRLYTENKSPEARKEIMPFIQDITREMNKERTDFNLPTNHFIITPYWLLGFVEGDGSFICKTKGSFVFSIGQKGNKALLVGIKDFLQALSSKVYNNEKVAEVSPQGEGQFMITIISMENIERVFIPLFDGLIWRTKKYLDYCDWKAILNIRNKGLHYLPEGKALIERIKQQMNNNRLSTSGMPKIDRTLLKAEIAKLLSGPSNYEIRDGKTYIISLNRYRKYISNKAQIVQLVDTSSGNIICTFNSQVDCAKFLQITKAGIAYRIKNCIHFTYEDRASLP